MGGFGLLTLRDFSCLSYGTANVGSTEFVIRSDWLTDLMGKLFDSIHEGPGVFFPPSKLESIPKLTCPTGVCIFMSKIHNFYYLFIFLSYKLNG